MQLGIGFSDQWTRSRDGVEFGQVLIFQLHHGRCRIRFGFELSSMEVFCVKQDRGSQFFLDVGEDGQYAGVVSYDEMGPSLADDADILSVSTTVCFAAVADDGINLPPESGEEILSLSGYR